MFSHYATRKISPVRKISIFSHDLSFLNPRSHLKLCAIESITSEKSVRESAKSSVLARTLLHFSSMVKINFEHCSLSKSPIGCLILSFQSIWISYCAEISQKPLKNYNAYNLNFQGKSCFYDLAPYSASLKVSRNAKIFVKLLRYLC